MQRIQHMFHFVDSSQRQALSFHYLLFLLNHPINKHGFLENLPCRSFCLSCEKQMKYIIKHDNSSILGGHLRMTKSQTNKNTSELLPSAPQEMPPPPRKPDLAPIWIHLNPIEPSPNSWRNPRNDTHQFDGLKMSKPCVQYSVDWFT